VEAHKGKISISSVQGSGTTVEIRLPVPASGNLNDLFFFNESDPGTPAASQSHENATRLNRRVLEIEYELTH
jgi:hypothetical protein